MTTYMSRSAWTTTARGGAALTGSQLIGIAVHWPGTSTPEYGAETASAVASRLRGWRDFHVNGRGWSDIGYNVGIDQAGRVWDLRGVGRVGAHAASASNPDANHEWFGVLLILGAREEPSAAMVAAFRHFRYTVFFERYGSDESAIRGHGQVPGAQTSCPGSRVLSLIGDGTLGRPPGTDDKPEEEDMSWDFKGLDYVNKDATSKDSQLARAHQYAFELHQEKDKFSWRFRGLDYVNENPTTKDHQLARVHQRTHELRFKKMSKPDHPDENDWNLLAFSRWSYAHGRRASTNTRELLREVKAAREENVAILSAVQGLDTGAVLARIDQHHQETTATLDTAEAELSAVGDRLDMALEQLDDVAQLLTEFESGQLDAEQVVSKMGELLSSGPPESAGTEE